MKKNRIVVSLVSAALLLATSWSVFGLYQESQLQQRQIADYELHVKQLLTQVEENSVLRLDYDHRVEQLQSQLSTVSSQLASVNNQLEITKDRINPDYQQIENEIRHQLVREAQAQTNRQEDHPTMHLVRQLLDLDPAQMTEVMQIQGQFGGFLQSLSVSDERMEVIVGALGNLIAERDQARSEMMLQFQQAQAQAQAGGQGQDGGDRRTLRLKMAEMMQPQNQLESLSYELTEDELAAFSEFQSTQRGQFGGSRAVFRSSIDPAGNTSAIYSFTTDVGEAGAIRASQFIDITTIDISN